MKARMHAREYAGEGLWLGAVGHSHRTFFGAMSTMQANATVAYATVHASGQPPPRPHLHMRPSVDKPPEPAQPSGAIHLDLASFQPTRQIMQSSWLAGVSWCNRVEGMLFMGSPWDDGVLACPDTVAWNNE